MLRAIGHPVTFAGLLVGFLLAVAVHGLAQAGAARWLGRERWAVREYRTTPARLIDPFGAVAAVLVGPGWGPARDPQYGSRGRKLAILLAGPVAVLVVAALAVLGYLAIAPEGGRILLDVAVPSNVVQGIDVIPAGPAFLLALAVEAAGVAALSIVPLPPLTGWRILMLFRGRSNGWQKAHYYLEERNFGVVALLVLLILPIGVGGPILLQFTDWLAGLLLSLAA